MNRALFVVPAPRLVPWPDTRDEAADPRPASLTGHATVVSATTPDGVAARRTREGAPC